MNSQSDAKQVVMSCVNAINEEDCKKARQYVSDDISFVGAMGSRQGADQVADGKIHSLKVVFDPRPILEARSRQEKSA